jgi:hypothetical protein
MIPTQSNTLRLVGGGRANAPVLKMLNGTPRQRVALIADPRLHAVSCKIALNLVLQAHAHGAKSLNIAGSYKTWLFLARTLVPLQVE